MDKIAALSEILAQDPSNAFARYGLALEYSNQGKSDEALVEFQKLREYQPDYVPGYQMAAQLLMKLARNEEAFEQIQTGIHAAEKTNNHHALSELSGMLAELS